MPIESRAAGPRPGGSAEGTGRNGTEGKGHRHRRSTSMLSRGAPLGGTLIGFHSLVAEEKPKGSGCSGD